MTNSFHEVRFPASLSQKSRGGPVRAVDVLTLASGAEERNAIWAGARRVYSMSVGLSAVEDLRELLAFYEARGGALYGFRFKDPLDFGVLNGAIGVGDGVQASFQLSKGTRIITKPVAGTVRVFVNGVQKTLTTHFTVDVTTGIVSFTAGNIPADGAAITASFEFDVPVRFDVEQLDINFSQLSAGDALRIKLVEVVQ